MENTELQAEIGSVQQYVASLVVTDEPSYQEAGKFLVGVKALESKVLNFTGPFVKAAFEAHKKVKARENEMIQPIQEAKVAVQRILGAYQTKLREAAMVEQKRLADEARRKADEEAQRKALALEAQGKPEEAAKVVEAAVNAPAPVPVVRPVDTPKVAGTRTVTKWNYEITDLSALPREFMIPNDKMLKSYTHGGQQVAGVRVWSEQVVQ